MLPRLIFSKSLTKASNIMFNQLKSTYLINGYIDLANHNSPKDLPLWAKAMGGSTVKLTDMVIPENDKHPTLTTSLPVGVVDSSVGDYTTHTFTDELTYGYQTKEQLITITNADQAWMFKKKSPKDKSCQEYWYTALILRGSCEQRLIIGTLLNQPELTIDTFVKQTTTDLIQTIMGKYVLTSATAFFNSNTEESQAVIKEMFSAIMDNAINDVMLSKEDSALLLRHLKDLPFVTLDRIGASLQALHDAGLVNNYYLELIRGVCFDPSKRPKAKRDHVGRILEIPKGLLINSQRQKAVSKMTGEHPEQSTVWGEPRYSAPWNDVVEPGIHVHPGVDSDKETTPTK